MKNQISEYYVSSIKEYNKKDMKLIDEKLPNLVGVFKRKTKKSMKCD